MKNEDYIQAHMLIPEQNQLLITQTDNINYALLCNCLLKNKKFLSSLLRFAYKSTDRITLIDWILSKTTKLNNLGFKVNFSTRAYWIANGLIDFPKCKRNECSNLIGLTKNVMSFTRGYPDHCCVACINKDQKVRKQIATTKIEKYGDSAFNNRPKNNITCIAKYGTTNGGGSSLAHSKMHRKYYFNEQYFDSAPEIAYFIWLTDHQIDFQYQPSQPFTYKFNGKSYKYFVDFKVNDQFIEIKGDQFFNDDGILFCPYRKKTWTDKQYAKINERYAIKHKCMLDNNVIILRYKDYKPFLDYVSQKYGKDYLKQFRVQRKKEQEKSEQTSTDLI